MAEKSDRFWYGFVWGFVGVPVIVGIGTMLIGGMAAMITRGRPLGSGGE